MSAPDATATSVGSPQTANTTALMAVVGRLKEYGSTVFKQRKPWTEVFDRSALSKPANLSEAATRIRKNASYFRVNYLIVIVATCAITFLMHPTSLFVLAALLAGWLYLFFVRTTPLVINGRTFSEREKLLGMSALSFITIFFLTSVGSVFFYAMSLSFALILLHGGFREPDNLFVDEGETQQSFFSILTGASTPAAAMATAV